MAPQELQLELVPAPGTAPRTLDQQTADLARELGAVRGVEVNRARTAAPDGVKAPDAASIQALLVTLGGAGGAVTALVGVLRSWVTRQGGRTVRLRLGDDEVEVTGASRDMERRVLALLERSLDDA